MESVVQTGREERSSRPPICGSVAAVARLLRSAQRPVVVAGFGAVAASGSAALRELAQRLPRLRVTSTPRAKGVFSEVHPAYLGVVGFAGQPEANHYVFEEADWVVLIGSRLGEMTSDNWDPRWERVNLIRIDLDAYTARFGCNPRIGLVGDARVLLTELVRELAALGEKGDNCAQQAVDVPLALPVADARLTPLAVIQTLNWEYPDQGHLFCGIGNSMAWAIHGLRRRVPNRWHLNLNSGAMGHALPAAIGAAVLGAPTLALLGDAELLMTGFELHTAVENDLSVIVLVLNDEGHGMVRQGSQAHCAGAAPVADFSKPVDLVLAARAQGVVAERVNTVGELVTALRGALSRRGPTFLEVPIERCHVPPLGARLAALSQAFGIGRQA